MNGREARSIHLTFYQQNGGIRLDRTKQRYSRSYVVTEPRESKDTALKDLSDRVCLVSGLSS